MSELDLNAVVEIAKRGFSERIYPKDTIYEVKHFGNTLEWTKQKAQAETVYNNLRGEKKLFSITHGKKELLNASYLA